MNSRRTVCWLVDWFVVRTSPVYACGCVFYSRCSMLYFVAWMVLFCCCSHYCCFWLRRRSAATDIIVVVVSLYLGGVVLRSFYTVFCECAINGDFLLKLPITCLHLVTTICFSDGGKFQLIPSRFGNCLKYIRNSGEIYLFLFCKVGFCCCCWLIGRIVCMYVRVCRSSVVV